MALSVKHLRLAVLPAILIQAAAAAYVLSSRGATDDFVPVSSNPDAGSAAVQQRIQSLRLLMDRVKGLRPEDEVMGTDLASYLNTHVLAPPTQVTAEGKAAAAPPVDYDRLGLGLLHDRDGWRLLVGDDAFRAGQTLPGGDRLISVNANSAVIRRSSGERLRLSMDKY